MSTLKIHFIHTPLTRSLALSVSLSFSLSLSLSRFHFLSLSLSLIRPNSRYTLVTIIVVVSFIVKQRCYRHETQYIIVAGSDHKTRTLLTKRSSYIIVIIIVGIVVNIIVIIIVIIIIIIIVVIIVTITLSSAAACGYHYRYHYHYHYHFARVFFFLFPGYFHVINTHAFLLQTENAGEPAGSERVKQNRRQEAERSTCRSTGLSIFPPIRVSGKDRR